MLLACECSSRRPLFHRYRSVEGVMLLDPATVANLELLRNLRTGDPKASLFGALNQVTLRIGGWHAPPNASECL